MHHLSSLYRVTTPLHVSGLLVAHHQEAAMYTQGDQKVSVHLTITVKTRKNILNSFSQLP
jgi:hypothetical protein